VLSFIVFDAHGQHLGDGLFLRGEVVALIQFQQQPRQARILLVGANGARQSAASTRTGEKGLRAAAI